VNITKQKTSYLATFDSLNSHRFPRKADAAAWLARMERGEAFKWVDCGASDFRLVWSLNEWASLWQIELKQWIWALDAKTQGHETTRLKAMAAARAAIHRRILPLVAGTLFSTPSYEVQIGGYRVDCVLPNGAVVECDGATRMGGSGSHGRGSAEREYPRRNTLTAAGYRVYHVTPELLWCNPLCLLEFTA
jgi:very-short-patch-repair endonuclease